jgi:hypothetical protein
MANDNIVITHCQAPRRTARKPLQLFAFGSSNTGDKQRRRRWDANGRVARERAPIGLVVVG